MNLKDLLTFVVIMIFFYLLSSFIALSFNPASWDVFGRAFLSIIGTIIAIGLIGVINSSKES